MAMIFQGYRPRIAMRMAAGDKDIRRWLGTAIFAKATTGHWLAWHEGDASKVAVLPPDHPEGKPGFWIESWEPDYTIEKAIEYVETGRFDTEEPEVLNMFIFNETTGKWE